MPEAKGTEACAGCGAVIEKGVAAQHNDIEPWGVAMAVINSKGQPLYHDNEPVRLVFCAACVRVLRTLIRDAKPKEPANEPPRQ